MPAQVIIGSDDEEAAVILKAEESSEDLRNYAGRMNADVENLEFLRE